jgi:hypothetical protein
VRSAAGSDLKDVPFEMLVLEVLLDATQGGGLFLRYILHYCVAYARAAKRGSARVSVHHSAGPNASAAASSSSSSSSSSSGAAGSDESAVRSAAGSDLKDVPFEMLVLEVLLDATQGGRP